MVSFWGFNSPKFANDLFEWDLTSKYGELNRFLMVFNQQIVELH